MLERLFKLLFKDPPDKRDKKFTNTKANRIRFKELPERIHWGTKLTYPPVNQQSMGSCVGCAGVSGLQMAINRPTHIANEHIDLSEQWLYFKSEEIDNHAPEGTYIRCAMKVMHQQGVPMEKVWPYKPDFFNPGCPVIPYEPMYKIKSYHRITTLKQTLKALVNEQGFVVCAVRVYHGCYSTNKWNEASGRYLGGHAVHLVGYDQGRQEIYFNNSWGKNWGFCGQGIMSYDYYKKNLMDAWYANYS